MLRLARPIHLLFPWTSISAGWCPLGVSPVDLPASMYLRPRYQEPTQNFRVFVETLACPEFSGFFGCPQLPTMALLHHFWNPKLNCHFLGRNKAGLQPKSPCFYAFLQWCIRKKQTPCFFEYPSLRFSYNLPFETGAPRKLAPRLVFIPAIENAWDLCSAVGQGIEF